MQQPPPQEPTNPPPGQPLPYPRSDQPFITSPSPSSPEYAPIFPAPSSDYPSGRRYYGEIPRSDGPVIRQQTDRDKVIDGPPGQPGPSNPWRTIALVLLVTTLILAGTTALLVTHRSVPIVEIGGSTSTAPSVGSTPTNGTSTGATATAPASANETPTAAAPSPDNYLAALPGPGCDKGEGRGTWTPAGPISNISCDTNGTTITVGPEQSRGYLYLQLPNNETFSQNNTIGILGNLQGYDGPNDDCLGLAEQNATTGFLAEFCENGDWFIDSIANTGAVTQTLDKSITSTRTSEKLSLTLQDTTLTFSIDTETYQVKNISPIQPTKVAITYFSGSYGNVNVPVENFSYTVLSS